MAVLLEKAGCRHLLYVSCIIAVRDPSGAARYISTILAWEKIFRDFFGRFRGVSTHIAGSAKSYAAIVYDGRGAPFSPRGPGCPACTAQNILCAAQGSLTHIYKKVDALAKEYLCTQCSVQGTKAMSSTRGWEVSRRGGGRVGKEPGMPVPPPSSNRTCGFPASGLPAITQSEACVGHEIRSFPASGGRACASVRRTRFPPEGGRIVDFGVADAASGEARRID